MYLVSQLWWFLLLAFLLGALVGYLLWRACGRHFLLAEHEREKAEFNRRIAVLEQARDRLSAAARDDEQELARLREALRVSMPGKKG